MSDKSAALLSGLSALASLAAVVLIGALWSQKGPHQDDNTVPIYGPKALEAYLAREDRDADAIQFKGDQIRIPTGLFIQSIAFASPSDVNFTGYIWQKYPEGQYMLAKDVSRGGLSREEMADRKAVIGVVFPEQVASSDTVLERVYQCIDGPDCPEGYDLFGWYFDVTVRQSFDYSDYPLDYQTLWLRIWPNDFRSGARIFMVPDFDAYYLAFAGADGAFARCHQLMDGTALGNGQTRPCGLDEDLVQGEWQVDESYFSYHHVPYDTRFGFKTDHPTCTPDCRGQVFSELYFNLSAKRNFISAFVVNLVPVFVVSLLLFGALLITTNKATQSDRFGFNFSAVMATCSGLFFAVLLSHVHIRSEFSGSGLVYIEYFYLVMYVMLFLVATNAYLFSIENERLVPFLHIRDNLICKVLYWPVLLWMLALVTWQEL